MQGRLLCTGYSDGAANMAIDEMLLLNGRYILRERYQAILRLYGWSKPTLSLGYFQPSSLLTDSLRCPDTEKYFSFDMVRRLTGGATILHDMEITYSFIIAEDNPLIPREVTDSYQAISLGIVRGLDKIGVKAGFFKAKDETGSKVYRAKSNFCFANHSKYDVVFKGKKIVGSAQRRKDGIILQHGAILLDIDREKAAYLFSRGIDCFREAISLKDILGYRLDFGTAARILSEGFKESLRMDFNNEVLTIEEQRSAEALKQDKYSRLEWTGRAGVIR
jgi:lipoyl(octanoyl) transferase